MSVTLESPTLRSGSLALYRLFSRVGWPRSYAGKHFFVAFTTVHVPLIGLVAWLCAKARVEDHLDILIVATVSTLVGTGLALVMFRELLAPVKAARDALHAYLDDGILSALPTDHPDEAGRLMRDVATVLRSFDARTRELTNLATRDPLTGLSNRRSAIASVQEDLRRGSMRCLAIVDLDHFQTINEQFGIGAGDRVLVEIGSLLVSSVRGIGAVSRWGGDEFMITIDARPTEALALCETIRTAVASRVFDVGRVQTGLSIGLTKVDAASSVERAVSRAERALVQAKVGGRDRVEVADVDAFARAV